jgi:REP element-mobilizing transposase RayT
MALERFGWSSRGYLPHFDGAVTTQSVTYRLADALPRRVVLQLDELKREDARRAQVEWHLDAGHGSCLLGVPEYAAVVCECWQFFNERRYWLHAWCIMPNHVHVLLQPLARNRLATIVHSQKSYTAKVILSCLPGTAGLRPASNGKNAGGTPAVPELKSMLPTRRVWHHDYFDRFIRDEGHYRAVVNYIHENPVKAGLVSRAVDWRWSSAREWASKQR